VGLEFLKILIVDDMAHTRALLAEILRAIGIRQIHEASDGGEGLQLMQAHPIDVVLTDLTMEPLDGADFVRWLRTSPDSPNPTVPVLMITGRSTPQHLREVRDAGANASMAKPITARGLIGRLQEVIDDRRPFVSADDYFGPDRRRARDPDHDGPWRRAVDGSTVRPIRG
jgi:CheY-like chemotaxis protein